MTLKMQQNTSVSKSFYYLTAVRFNAAQSVLERPELIKIQIFPYVNYKMITVYHCQSLSITVNPFIAHDGLLIYLQ